MTSIEMTEDPEVVRTWRNNQSSATIMLSLPIRLCRKYGIDHHTNLFVLDTNDGILLKKVQTEMIQ